jgi:hypothetical protein
LQRRRLCIFWELRGFHVLRERAWRGGVQVRQLCLRLRLLL